MSDEAIERWRNSAEMAGGVAVWSVVAAGLVWVAMVTSWMFTLGLILVIAVCVGLFAVACKVSEWLYVNFSIGGGEIARDRDKPLGSKDNPIYVRRRWFSNDW